MTPLEIHEHKLKWKPGFTVRLHSDVVDKGKTWCRTNLESLHWSVTTWTDVYEHTFHFEYREDAIKFEEKMGRFANQ